MARFFGILLLNVWRGLRRGSREIAPAALTVLASLAALLVTSNVATASPDSAAKTPAPLVGHLVTTQNKPAIVLSLLTAGQSGSVARHTTKNRHHAGNIASGAASGSLFLGNTQTSSSSNNGSGRSGQSNGQQATTPGSVVLSQVQTECQQNQPIYEVDSATVNLSTPTTAAGTASWYWETRSYDGSTSSGTPTINFQGSQSVDANTSVITLTSAASDQPLLSAPGNANAAYSLRLHVVVGGSELTSAWINVPQGGSC